MISVCIATYNGEKYIKQQLDTIIPQLNDEDEVIVSDNGSTDSTIEIIKSIGDSRIRIVEGPEEKSAIKNFENALRESKGEYIFLSDQDDLWKNNKVKVCMHWLQQYDCVISNAEMIDNDLNITDKSYFKVHNTRQGRLYNTLIKNGYMGCCMAFTRKVLDDSLPLPKDIPLHDIWIGNIAAYFHSVRFIDEPLIQFRCHSSNTSFTARKKSKNSIYKMFVIRWKTVKNLLIKALKR